MHGKGIIQLMQSTRKPLVLLKAGHIIAKCNSVLMQFAIEFVWNCVALRCRIFQFENFARTKKRVLAREPQGGALVG